MPMKDFPFQEGAITCTVGDRKRDRSAIAIWAGRELT